MRDCSTIRRIRSRHESAACRLRQGKSEQQPRAKLAACEGPLTFRRLCCRQKVKLPTIMHQVKCHEPSREIASIDPDTPCGIGRQGLDWKLSGNHEVRRNALQAQGERPGILVLAANDKGGNPTIGAVSGTGFPGSSSSDTGTDEPGGGAKGSDRAGPGLAFGAPADARWT